MEIKDQVILVTGGARGLGFAMLAAFGERGGRLVVCDRAGSAAAAETLRAQGYDATGIDCNVTEESSVVSAFEQIAAQVGPVNIAILNAGILRDGLLIRFNKATGKIKGKMSLEQWQSVIDVNLTGVFLTGREAAAQMAEAGGGLIIPISSVAMHGNPGQSNYSAAKAGVAALTRLWAQELSRFKIRVCGIAPGFIATEMVLKDMNAKALEEWQSRIPIGRLGRPDEIAHTAVFIAENDLMTGVVVEASGGIKI
ncbi:MAG: SDR family oxidoreductase [Spirochaetales bacterium]|nr:SDR family oxidoreductase [Spirochaetales bacterium]